MVVVDVNVGDDDVINNNVFIDGLALMVAVLFWIWLLETAVDAETATAGKQLLVETVIEFCFYMENHTTTQQ